MNKLTRDFISNERRDFKFKLGSTLASALTGFLAGVISATFVFWVAYSMFAK